MTWNDLIKSSLRLIGQLGPGRSPGPSETTDALFVLNSMLEAWNTESLNIYQIADNVYPLTAGKGSYTIGPAAADFTAPRPQRITAANIVSGSMRQPVKIIGHDEWAGIGYPSVQSIPSSLYHEGSYPNSTIWLYPVPGSSDQLELFTWAAIVGNVSNTAATVDFPPGYADAIRFNLAVRLSPEWGKEIRPDVLALAVQSKADIQSLNSQAPAMQCDPAVLGGGSWSILSGDYE